MVDIVPEFHEEAPAGTDVEVLVCVPATSVHLTVSPTVAENEDGVKTLFDTATSIIVAYTEHEIQAVNKTR